MLIKSSALHQLIRNEKLSRKVDPLRLRRRKFWIRKELSANVRRVLGGQVRTRRHARRRRLDRLQFHVLRIRGEEGRLLPGGEELLQGSRWRSRSRFQGSYIFTIAFTAFPCDVIPTSIPLLSQ